ncbi:MAG TPA: selenocysteine-specific translation elongation factor [Clostridia bacterium]|nr:selenocysteine-specific translation elongation factor [Clostridia bacterium]
MKSVIVGTAGHIDHGKTALVRALTGIDTDRLEEEKRRGITIDLGFAHLELPTAGDSVRLGFVDVPGHERFVRNMLAGVGGIDLVLLVISAEESIKPQTREHFDICRLLSVRRGITVLTKSDLVDPETLEVVRMEVEEFVRGSFLDASQSPIIAVSAKNGEGLDVLRTELARVANEVSGKNTKAPLRLPIDRVFSIKGFGTVVTGTMNSGRVRREQEIELLPSAERLRVRGVQVHGNSADEAVAGQRTALNLAGVGTEELARGMMLAEAGLFRPTRTVGVSLSLLPTAKPLKDRARVHFHAYTAEMLAEVVLLGTKELLPGTTGLAELRLTDPILLLPEDRFIVRQFSPVVTIGGGVVLENTSAKRLTMALRREALQVLADVGHGASLETRVAAMGQRGMTFHDAVARTGWTRVELEEKLRSAQPVRRIAEALIHDRALEEIRREIVGAIETFHKQNPLSPGMNIQELRGGFEDVLPEVFAASFDALLQEKMIEVTGDIVRAAGRGIVMRDDEAEAKQKIETAFATAGLKVPALKDVLASVNVDRTRAHKIMTLLLRDKVLVKLTDELVFHRDALDGLRQQMALEKAKSAKIDVARFKDMTGVTRKYAIPLLEYLDREKVTRRVGDERVIL